MTGAQQGQQGKLLRESLDTLLSQGTAMSESFFETLFATHSEFRERFARVDLSTQHEAFLAALKFVAENYEQRAILERTLRELGARHARYGLRQEHFGVFGACLLDTMAHFAGPGWTLAVDLAWRTAFENMAETMLLGAVEVNTTPAARAG